MRSSCTTHSVALATTSSARWRAYSSAPTTPAATRATTIDDDQDDRQRIAEGPLDERAALFGRSAARLRRHPRRVVLWQRIVLRRPLALIRRRLVAGTAVGHLLGWRFDRPGAAGRVEPGWPDGPRDRSPQRLCPTDELNSVRLWSTATVSRAFSTAVRSRSDTNNCWSDPAEGHHLTERRGHHAVADTGGAGGPRCHRPDRPDRPRRRSRWCPLRGRAPAASTARASPGPNPMTRAR